jgi:ABC-2 type transport system ATP-binding protein
MPGYSVEARNLTIRFGEFTAVDRVSFAVSPGEIFGFLGANGAGKTTTIRTLCGLLLPTEGRVFVAGLDVREKAQEVKSRVGYMSQRFTLYQDMTVEENLTFTGNLRKLDPGFVKVRTRELLDFIGFKSPLTTMVSALVGGLKQEVALVAALLHDPDVLFLDEPTSGVTPSARARFWDLIRGVADRGKTVFVTTHYMDEAEQCGRIALMRQGALIALDTPEGLKRHAFPIPLFEVEPLGSEPGALAALALSPAVGSWRPYGRRFHAAVRDLPAWERTVRPGVTEGRWTVREIRPSLEDVFLELVEGHR